MFGTPNYNYATQFPVGGTQHPQNSIIWVQGEAGAKSYLVGAGQSVLLMDSEDNVFYIKSTDQSGMPMPLRVFEYTERTSKPEPVTADFITREEFEKRLAELKDAK